MKSLSATVVLLSLLVCHGFRESVAEQPNQRPNERSSSIGGGFGSFGNAGDQFNGQGWMSTSGFSGGSGGGSGVGSGFGGGNGQEGSFGGTSGFDSESKYFKSGGSDGLWSTWPSPSYSWRWISGPSRGNQHTSGLWGQMGSPPTSWYYYWGNPSGQGFPGGFWGMQGQESGGGQLREQTGSGDQSRWFSEGNLFGQVERQGSRGGGQSTGLIGRLSGMEGQEGFGSQQIRGNGNDGAWNQAGNLERQTAGQRVKEGQIIFTGPSGRGSDLGGEQEFESHLIRSNGDQSELIGENIFGQLGGQGRGGQGGSSGRAGEQEGERRMGGSRQLTGRRVHQAGQVDGEGFRGGQSERRGFGEWQTEQWGQGRQTGAGHRYWRTSGRRGRDGEGDEHGGDLGRLTVPFGVSRLRGRQFGSKPDLIYKMSFTGFGRGQDDGQTGMGSFSGLGVSGGLPITLSSTGGEGLGGISGSRGAIFFSRSGKRVSQKTLRRLYKKYLKRGQGHTFIQFLQQSGILVKGFGAPLQGGSNSWYWTSGPQYWTWEPQTSSQRPQSWVGGSQSGAFGSGFGASSGLGMGGSSGSGFVGDLGLGSGSGGTSGGSFGTDNIGGWGHNFGSGSSNVRASSGGGMGGPS